MDARAEGRTPPPPPPPPPQDGLLGSAPADRDAGDDDRDRRRAEEQEDDDTRAARGDKWARLRRAVFSASRAELFVDVPELEVGLFEKHRETSSEGVKLRFGGWHPRAREKILAGVPAFAAVDIVRPRFEHADDAGAQAKEDQVDTTGLLKLYPSEEVLGAYLLLHAAEFANQQVLELGAGFCGLAGLLLARRLPTGSSICLSDGSQACLDLAERHISLNGLQATVTTQRILWDRKADYAGHQTFDTIIISDCLYLNKLHADLLNAIFHLLRDESSRCLIVSPPRYKSLELFTARAAARFHVRQSTKEIDFLDAIRDETTRGFRPFFVELRKKSSPA